jgi:hypothetical protein
MGITRSLLETKVQNQIEDDEDDYDPVATPS